MSNTSPWLVYALLSAFFAALTAIFAKAGLKNVNSDLATAIRTVIILLMTWGIVLYKKNWRELSSLSTNTWVFLILSSLATGLSWLFYYRALQSGNVSQVSIIDRGSILFVLILSFLFLKEPITPRILAGAALIFAGMIVVTWK